MHRNGETPTRPSEFDPVVFSPDLFADLELSSLSDFLLGALSVTLDTGSNSLFVFFLGPSVSPVITFPRGSLFVSPGESTRTRLFGSNVVHLPSVVSVSSTTLPIVSSAGYFDSITILKSFKSPVITRIETGFAYSVIAPGTSEVLLV